MTNLGSKRGNAAVAYDDRIAALEAMVQRIPARTRERAVPVSRTLVQSAHGFQVGQPIARTGSTWAAAGVGIGGAGPVNSRIGVVTRVLDVNTFVVVFHGLARVTGSPLTLTAWTTYFLPITAGAPMLTASPAGLVAGIAKRAVLIALDAGWVYVIGTEFEQHDHRIQDARDVDRTVTPNNGDILAFQTSDGSMKWTSVLAAFGSRAATSVVGNATGATAAATDIAATADGQILQRAAGALSWGLIGSESIAAGAVLAAALGSDVKLTALKDVSIASQVANDVPMWDGTNWVRRNLGPMAYSVVASYGNQLSLDGPTGVAAINVGLAANGSRLVLGGSSQSLDFLLVGNIGLGSDLVARMKTLGTTGVGFYDQARGLPDGSTTAAAAGTEVMEWGCNITPSSRYFRFKIDAQFQDAASGWLTLHGQAAGLWRILDSTATTYLDFVQNDATDGQKIKIRTSLDLFGNTLYFNGGSGGPNARIAGTANDITLTAVTSASGVITLFGFTTAISTSKAQILTAGGQLAFFGGTPVFKSTVAAPSAVATTQTAGASYTSNEQTMLANLKTDVTNLRATVASLRSVLNGYGLL